MKLPLQPLDPDSPSSERLFVQALGRLPMFPLPGVVLFPHAMLPLHIFEERYRKMTRDVLESHRHLAMAMLESPTDDAAHEGPAARPAVRPVMGVGEVVMAHELPDGRFNLVVRGRARVELQEELTTVEPYRMIVAHVRADAAVTQPRELADADQSLRALVGRLADGIPEGGELLRQVVASQATPTELADVLAAALVVDVRKRQRLLETRDLVKRIERVTAEVVAMTARLGSTAPAN
ncbi:MAG TPA: LON peptidase substrate-binding domain-containing protein [Polyangia bacterium]|nr:LON peptidase substrate-binding domain-containing protein [Polyangia bacterium]